MSKPVKKDSYQDYFNRARTWADDNFSQLQQSRNRYQTAFLLAMGLNIAAVFGVAILANMQTLVPLLVHHYDNGIVTVEPLTNKNAPINKAQVESDIAKYITNREAYDSASYRAQFDLIALLSDEKVNKEYLQEQDKNTKEAPINTLSLHASRSVHIYNINFLDTLIFNQEDLHKNHQNVAEVAFTITDTDKNNSSKTAVIHYNALISWQYATPSKVPGERWLNWDGFRVIRYSKQMRNV